MDCGAEEREDIQAYSSEEVKSKIVWYCLGKLNQLLGRKTCGNLRQCAGRLACEMESFLAYAAVTDIWKGKFVVV